MQFCAAPTLFQLNHVWRSFLSQLETILSGFPILIQSHKICQWKPLFGELSMVVADMDIRAPLMYRRSYDHDLCDHAVLVWCV